MHVITFTQADSPTEDDKDILIHRVKPLLKWYKASFSPQVRDLIKYIQPDIVHIHAPAPLTQEHALMKGYRYLATYHADLALTDRPTYQMSAWFYRRFIFPTFSARVDRIISPSRSFQQASEFLKLVPKEKQGIISNGIDTSQFRLPPKPKVYYKQKLGLDADHVGIFVGSMDKWHAYKGVEILLEALSKLRNVELQFIFVGDGELRPRYEAIARRLIDRKRVMFLGKVDKDKLIECYWAADFLVLPSVRVESFGIVLIEAMASGCPVIVTDIPGPRDLVEDGFNGYKVKPNNPDALMKAIKLLILKGELKYMSSNSRKLAVEKYDWEKVVNAYMKEYKQLLSC